MHTSTPDISVSPFSTKNNTKPIKPTQNTNTLYQHQPNLAAPMTSTYTAFLLNTQQLNTSHNLSIEIHPHICQLDTETAVPLIDDTAITSVMQIHTRSAPYPITITISINNTLPIHHINMKQKRPRPSLMKQPAQPLPMPIHTQTTSYQSSSIIFFLIHINTETDRPRPIYWWHTTSHSPTNSCSNSLITNILSLYPYSLRINLEITTTRLFFMTQPSLSLTIHIRTTSIHYISNEYTLLLPPLSLCTLIFTSLPLQLPCAPSLLLYRYIHLHLFLKL